MKISCKQFEDLIPFYLNDELSDSLKNAFVEHLHNCPHCHIKFNMLNSIVNDLKDAYNQLLFEPQNEECTPEEQDDETNELNTELSAYIDNELNEDASIQLRKNIISKPALRKKFDNLYSLKKMMTNSFNEEKNKFKYDFSKEVLKKIQTKKTNNDSFSACFLFIGFVISALIISFIVLKSLL